MKFLPVLALVFLASVARATDVAVFPEGTEFEIIPTTVFAKQTEATTRFSLESENATVTIGQKDWLSVRSPLFGYKNMISESHRFYITDKINLTSGNHEGFVGIYPTFSSRVNMIQTRDSEISPSLFSHVGNNKVEDDSKYSHLYGKNAVGPHLVSDVNGSLLYVGDGEMKISGLDFTINGEVIRTGHFEENGKEIEVWAYVEFQSANISFSAVPWKLTSAKIEAQWEGDALFVGDGTEARRGSATLFPSKQNGVAAIQTTFHETKVEQIAPISTNDPFFYAFPLLIFLVIGLGSLALRRSKADDSMEAAHTLLLAGGPKEVVMDCLEKAIREKPWFATHLKSASWDPIREEERFQRILRDARPTNK